MHLIYFKTKSIFIINKISNEWIYFFFCAFESSFINAASLAFILFVISTCLKKINKNILRIKDYKNLTFRSAINSFVTSKMICLASSTLKPSNFEWIWSIISLFSSKFSALSASSCLTLKLFELLFKTKFQNIDILYFVFYF